MGGGGKVLWMAPAGVVTEQAEGVEIVVLPDKRVAHDGIEGVADVIPDGFDFAAAVATALGNVIFLDHGPLRGGHASSFPGEPFGVDHEPVDRLVHEHATHARPNPALLVQGARRAEGVCQWREIEKAKEIADQADGVPGSVIRIGV